MHQPSPIVLFTYLRLETLQKTISALAANLYAADSDLIIFSDGVKYLKDEPKVQEIRSYLKSIQGFKSVVIHESNTNNGLAKSIIQGVSSVLKEYPSAIVLEDDLITSSNFLVFMNQALGFYQDKPEILSICGFSPIIKGLKDNEVYFTQRSSSWGWATWVDRWTKIDWTCESYNEFSKNSGMKTEFNAMGSDLSHMLKMQMEGYINSWAIRFCFYQFNHKLYSVHPAVSKISNEGFDEFSTNTKFDFNRFKTKIDQSDIQEFRFESHIKLNERVIKQFAKSNSILVRIQFKLLSLFKRNPNYVGIIHF
jgi:hypothetical protein